jgi:aerobic-type carbon monoxide dehydrogenase small subunit (CoxS/CutS family)
VNRPLRLTVNGTAWQLPVADGALLLDVLREQVGCTSVREGCGVGACGACTVLVAGPGTGRHSVSSCLVLAARYHDAELTTADGLPADDPVVEAFVAHGATQCGYCIPGFVLMAHELLSENPGPTRDEIVDHLAGNLCRCGTYQEICAAVASLAQPAEEPC